VRDKTLVVQFCRLSADQGAVVDQLNSGTWLANGDAIEVDKAQATHAGIPLPDSVWRGGNAGFRGHNFHGRCEGHRNMATLIFDIGWAFSKVLRV
jgi:hypothetical protein